MCVTQEGAGGKEEGKEEEAKEVNARTRCDCSDSPKEGGKEEEPNVRTPNLHLTYT